MLQVWGKLWKRDRICQSHTAEDDHQNWKDSVRLEVCIDEIIDRLDLPRPIWLAQNHEEMRQFGRTHFRQDHFIEQFPYQSFEIEIIRTDDDED